MLEAGFPQLASKNPTNTQKQLITIFGSKIKILVIYIVNKKFIVDYFLKNCNCFNVVFLSWLNKEQGMRLRKVSSVEQYNAC